MTERASATTSGPPPERSGPPPERDAAPGRATWKLNLLLLLATIASVFVTGALTMGGEGEGVGMTRESVVRGAQFAGTLLSILVAHELGHYVAARIHKVEASLPYFLPMPLLSPFGTMGAVIRMRGTIPTRRALLDIGAAGPLAGLVFAIPLYAYGASHSEVVALPMPTVLEAGAESGAALQLGESVLVKILDRLAGPHTPPGTQLSLSPIAFGAWGGLFVTMINLLPIGQLDGGHVAYALFGRRQDTIARYVHLAMLVFFFVVIAGHTARDVAAGLGFERLGRHLTGALFWLVWFEALAILGHVAEASSRAKDQAPPPGTLTVRTRLVAIAGLLGVAHLAHDSRSPLPAVAFLVGVGVLIAMEVKGGALRRSSRLLDHPPTDRAPLDRTRAVIAVITLAFFALLFMPEPFSM